MNDAILYFSYGYISDWIIFIFFSYCLWFLISVNMLFLLDFIYCVKGVVFCVKKSGVWNAHSAQSVAFCVACYGIVAQMRCMPHVCSLFQAELSGFNTAK